MAIMMNPHPAFGHLPPQQGEGTAPSPSVTKGQFSLSLWRERAGVRVNGFSILIVFLCCLSAHASVAQLKKANRLFMKGDYENALKGYNDALVDQPYSSILHFNAGDAAYQMGDFGKAVKEFETAAQSTNPLLKSAAHYNRGNALLQQQQWGEAVEAYKESLRINPQDEDAKYNLGIALRRQKNPPSSCKNPKSGNDKKQSQGGGGENQQDGQKDQGQSSTPRAAQMSREDAERLLSAAGAGELKKSNQKFQKSDVPHPDEDW